MAEEEGFVMRESVEGYTLQNDCLETGCWCEERCSCCMSKASAQ